MTRRVPPGRRPRDPSRMRVALLVTGLLLLAPSLAPPLAHVATTARPAPAGLETADGHEGEEFASDYVAQSMWGAKYLVNQHRVVLFLRPLWVTDPTGAGVRIGIVDTGIDDTHPDLADAVVAWRDFVGDEDGRRHAFPYDDHGHGTHVAAIAAGRGHFQQHPLKAYWLTGMKGIAPGADLLIAKAMDHKGRGSDQDVADAILWLVDPNGDGDLSDGADIINLSIGVERNGETVSFVGSATRRAVNLALIRGVTLVVSSGNDGASQVMEPGDVDEVITVGAVDRERRVTAFSNRGEHLDVLAPGVLLSAYPAHLDTMDFAQDAYAGMAGTSMAAPVVAGLVALAFEADPSLLEKGTDRDYRDTPRRMEALLRTHAEPLDGVPARAQGAGVVDAYGVLAAVDAGGGTFSWAGAAQLTGASLVSMWVSLGILGRLFRRREDGEVVEFEYAN